MRRIVYFMLIAALLLIGLLMPSVAQEMQTNQLMVTNTPRSMPAFATNTPQADPATPVPTATPTTTPSPTPTLTPTPTPIPIGPFTYPTGINPLTGLPYPDEAAMNRRNLIVKISNFPPVVRPQTGINSADVVYEMEAEGGVTRFAAIFRSNAPERVGSVRSARLVDLKLIEMYNALLAYSGTSEPIQQMILEADFVFRTFSPLKGDGCENAGFCRDNTLEDIDFEHTLFLNTQTLYDLATRRNVNVGLQARGFAFAETPDVGGLDAQDIDVAWFGQMEARWRFDVESARYLRFTDGVPHLDAADDSQLWADNLVFIEVPHLERPDLFPPGVDYASLDIDLTGQGRALVLRDGVVYEGFWRRQDERPGNALQVIYPGAPDPIHLKPGRTWVTVVRGLGNVSISETLLPLAESDEDGA